VHIFKAVHNLSENKKFGHHPQAMGYVCANFFISTICGFCSSMWKKYALFRRFSAYFSYLWQIMAQLENFLPKI